MSVRARSVRARLTLASTAVTAVVLVVASLLLVGLERRSLTDGIDEALRQRADNLEPVDPSLPIPPEGDPEDSFVQLLDANGTVVTATPNAPERPAIDPSAVPDAERSLTRELNEPSPDRFRLLTRPSGGDVLVLAKNLDDVDESIHALVTALAVVAPALLLFLGVLSWWLTGRALRPVEAIRTEAGSVTGSALDRRVSVPDSGDEIESLARTMNEMLDRIEAASIRQRRFVDDASHELRTPLTRILAELETVPEGAGADELRAALDDVTVGALDLRQLIADLLLLARSDDDSGSSHRPVDLDDIALDVARQARRDSPGLDITTDSIAAAQVVGDPRQLRRAAQNLVDNAVRHATRSIAIRTNEDADSCHLVVDDDGPGIPEADRERVLERFTRLDSSRARADGGFGLGLAIVADIARRHHGTITIGTAELGGARLDLRLPMAR